MHSTLVLLIGEFKRLLEYKIAAASVVVALIWIGVLYLTEVPDITFIFPMLIFIDATSMAILMVGVIIFFEKQEGSLKALLVSPISKCDYLLSKIVITICSSIITLIILYLYAALFKEISLNFFGLLGAVILVALFHSLVGLILSYYSKDFTSLLMNMMKYVFIFFIPTLFEYLDLFSNELVANLLYITPTKAALLLFTAPAGTVGAGELLYALIYMLAGSAFLFFLALKLFDSFAAREGGL